MIRRNAGILLVWLVAAGIPAGSAPADSAPATIPESQTVAQFQARVKEYVALHQKLESTLPKLQKQGTPEQVDKHQQALGNLIRTARREAQAGELFTPEMQALVQRVLTDVLAGPDGKTVKASIMDENPGVPKVVVNQRYPATVPLATMPQQVLARFPKLPEELEYRFLGPHLILLDTHADIIVDFTNPVMAP
jgi:hypothetical protein